MSIEIMPVRFLASDPSVDLSKVLLRNNIWQQAKEKGLGSVKVLIKPGSSEGVVIAEYESAADAKKVNLAGLLKKAKSEEGKNLLNVSKSTIYVNPRSK